MKKLPVIIAFLAILSQGGCQKPSPLTVEPPADSAPGLRVTVLSNPDSSVTVTPIDSVGVLPADQTNYSGLFLVNNVKYDYGHGTISTAYASAYFGDRNRPLVVNGKVLGYYGIDLMPHSLFPLKIGGIPMIRYPYRIHLVGRDTTFGFIYRAAFASFVPKSTFDWEDDQPDSTTFQQFRDTVQAPEDLKVLAPAGGSVLSRTKQVELRWTGSGPITVIVSSYNLLTGKTRPILQLTPSVNTGTAVVEPAILKALPQGRNFVLTFIIANKSDHYLGVALKDRTLVQAASVYNSYVQLQ